MTSVLDTYLIEIQQEEYINEVCEQITEAFLNISKEKIKNDITKNTQALKKLLLDYGVDIKNVTIKDADGLFKIIKKWYEKGANIAKASKDIFLYIIDLLKRMWNPESKGEFITSAILGGIILTFLCAVINSYAERFFITLGKKFASGVKAGLALFLRWIIGGALVEEIMKRLALKKWKNYGFISVAAFAIIETIIYKIQKGEGLIVGLAARLFFHLYTTFVQKYAADVAERTGKKWIEYAGFGIMVVLHALMNMNAFAHESGGWGLLFGVFTGSTELS